MKKKLPLSACTVLTVLLGTSAAFGQGSPPWKIVPVEIYACEFNERQDADDLNGWIARWNRWADSNSVDTYAAWTLTPFYYTTEQEFDFLWLGAATDGNAMGAGTDLWLSTGSELNEDLLEIVSCGAHIGLASAAYRVPAGLDNSQTGVITMSDCVLHDGVRFPALDSAARAWADVVDGAGSKVALYHWYPVYGGGDADFDFKWIEAYQNYSDLGADYERMGNGRLFEQYQSLFSHLMDCDDARVYNAQNRRYVQLR